MLRRTAPIVLAAILGLASPWGGASVVGQDSPEPPRVAVAVAASVEATDVEDFVGRLVPRESVEIRARAAGAVQRILFEAGSLVRRGDLLIEIDARLYQARLALAQAGLAAAEARMRQQQVEVERQKRLAASQAVRPEDVDAAMTELLAARAEVESARAAVAIAELELSMTRIESPIDGRIDASSISAGNLVEAGDRLTTLVSVDPVCVVFQMPEASFVKYRRRAQAAPVAAGLVPLSIYVASETEPVAGHLESIANAFDPITGSIAFRGVFPDPRQFYLPGMSARVRMVMGEPFSAIFVPKRGIAEDMEGVYVIVVDAKNSTARRAVVVGAVQRDRVEIKEGLRPGERVIVEASPALLDRVVVPVIPTEK